MTKKKYSKETTKKHSLYQNQSQNQERKRKNQ